MASPLIHREAGPGARLHGLVLVLAGCLACLLPALGSEPDRATRILPAYFEDLVPFPVLIQVTPPANTETHALEESIPSGFEATRISYGGTLDPAGTTIRWGPFPDDLPRTLSYTLIAPLDAPSSVTFGGIGVFQTTSTVVAGPTVLPKRPGITTRSLPSHYLPGTPVSVSLVAQPGASTLAWAVQESIPTGWTLVAIPSGAGFDPVSSTLKWGPFLDPAPRTFAYAVLPPIAERSPGVFTGSTVFESTPVKITGADSLPIQPSTLTRQFPPPFTPGSPGTASIHVQPAPYVAIHAVEEDVPPGLNIDEISPGGAWDPARRRIKWGPFPDSAPRTLTYVVIPSSADSDPQSFAGRGYFDSELVTTEGPDSWLPANPSPAPTLTADVPAFFKPGFPFDIGLESMPAPDTRIHAIELALPDGWSFVSASHGATFDALRRSIKWGPFQDDTSRPLRAEVLPDPDGAGGVFQFPALGWFDAREVPATGNLTTRPLPSKATREAPLRMTAGVPFTVHLDIEPSPSVALAFVEESLPENAVVSNITESGTLDPVQRKIKWGPFIGSTFRTLSYQVTVPGPSPRGALFSGTAAFDGESVPIAGPSVVPLDHPPSAQPESIQRPPAPTAKFSVLELLANDSDLDGDTLRVRSVLSPSAAGGIVRLIGPWVFYEAPVTGSAAEDQFSYVVEDAFGSTSVASTTVLFSSAPIASRLAITAVIPQPGGTALVRFRAVPGAVCRIEVSRNLREWSFLAEATTDPLGTGEVLDPDADAFPVRFYRASVR
ncbi:MAG: Ig-like domain-containing protein [Limisphaerales bacterium]